MNFWPRKDPLYGVPFDEIVSLGGSCRTAYQIALSNFRRADAHSRPHSSIGRESGVHQRPFHRGTISSTG